MIPLKTKAELKIMQKGGQRLARILSSLAKQIVPGLKTIELDLLARRLIAAGGDEPSFLHYRPEGMATPYPAALCVSINDEVVHGIPGQRKLQTGDIVSLDLGLKHGGFHTDMAITVPVGEISSSAARLVAETEKTLREVVKLLVPNSTLGDIGYFISQAAKKNNFGVVTELGGHGVGVKIHEAPQVPNFGERGRGLKLKAGMVLAIEPMFTLGASEVIFLPDDYTVKTTDGSLAAHFEQTVAVTENGPLVLTENFDIL